jgi:hypothetical protein
MPINFIPNDPSAGPTAPAMRVKPARSNRPASKSGFVFSGTSPQAIAAPGTPQFLFWQCREGAIAALEAWEASAGAHKRWQGNRRKLQLLQDAGEDLNAFYDRASFSFFHMAIGGTTFFSGASTDVVAHELGHGLLDSVRSDFFDVNFLEVGAFHEAFGDCMAILTALGDQESRQKLLAVTADLRKRNFVESTAEDLSAGIKLLQAGHNAAEPRHAFNTFKFRIPSTLPTTGGPGALVNEVHSFGMIFTGCFWDLIANIFAAGATKTEADLLSAARLAGKILIAGGFGEVNGVTRNRVARLNAENELGVQELLSLVVQKHRVNAVTEREAHSGRHKDVVPPVGVDVSHAHAPRPEGFGSHSVGNFHEPAVAEILIQSVAEDIVGRSLKVLFRPFK